jgi:hypothetical protein
VVPGNQNRHSISHCVLNANYPHSYLHPQGTYLKQGVGRPVTLIPPFFPKSLSLSQSVRVAILDVRHGSWWFPAVTLMLGEGFQDRFPLWPGSGCSPWVLEEVPQRWGSAIPWWPRLPRAWQTGSTMMHVQGLPARVRIFVGNPRGQRVACCSRETLLIVRS